MPMLQEDGFTLEELTAAINELPHVPTQLGDSGLFDYRGTSQLVVEVEKQTHTLALVPTRPRGAPGNAVGRMTRNTRPFRMMHLPIEDRILADEVQGVRAFGTEGSATSVDARVNEVLTIGRRRYDLTWEWHRINALKGIILDADGTTVLLNLFTEFGVTQNTIDFELDQAGTAVRSKCDQTVDLIEDALDGTPNTGAVAYCGRNFWKALITHPNVEKTYLNYQAAAELRGDTDMQFEFGGIVWRKYRGAANGAQMVEANNAYIIPTGVPDLLIGRFGPADYNETVNTVGLPIYARGIPMRNNKGWDLEMQSNFVHLLTRPRAVILASV